MSRYAEIVLPLPVERIFTYVVPPDCAEKILPGMRVLVPFGERLLTGFVVGLKKKRPGRNLKLKSVAELLDDSPLFSPSLLSFTRKLSQAYIVPWGEILQSAVPPSFILKSRTSLFLTPRGQEALEKSLLTEEERRVASCLSAKPHTLRYLERKCPAAHLSALLAGMQRKELIASRKEVKRVRRRPKKEPKPGTKQLELDFSMDENSRKAAGIISGARASPKFTPFLLLGAADRRRAVYFELIRKALSASGRVLYVVPEVSLTPALVDEVARKLGEAAAVLHGGMTEARREIEWQRIRDGRAQVVVGSRLALFAPVQSVKFVICDDEQDESYSPQEGLPYDVRAAAAIRAAEEAAILVSGSSAPAVESLYRARKARSLFDLGEDRKDIRISIVEHHPGRAIVCPVLERAVRSRLARKEPVILFFNRRGYASSLICPNCGFYPRCARCELPLSYHKHEGKFVCHYCRFSVSAYSACPRCGGRLGLKKGAGVEALAEELRRVFPQARVDIFAVDEAGRKDVKENLKREFQDGRVNILVGTQLLTHQVNFPKASLVGILHPEFSLHLADFRSGQKTFQAILRELQFLREGRGAEAVVQTSAPDHFSIREAVRGDYRAFYEQEITFRRLMDYPPFSALAEVNLMGSELRKVAAAARVLSGRARDAGPAISQFGPSLAPPARVGGLHRVQIVLKAPSRERLHRFLRGALQGIGLKKSVVFSS
jgi:primosomal protein N' (replication factor Y)